MLKLIFGGPFNLFCYKCILTLAYIFFPLLLYSQYNYDFVVETNERRVLDIENLEVPRFVMKDGSTLVLTGVESFNLNAKESIIGNNCQIIGIGAAGSPGLDGQTGANGGGDCMAGLPGGNGQRGSDGTNGLNITILTEFTSLGSLSINTQGGRGGSGGNGGRGGAGGKADVSRDCRGANGGNGGVGGDSGMGGNGGNVIIEYFTEGVVPAFNVDTSESVINTMISGGSSGQPGLGGEGGAGGASVSRELGFIKISKGSGSSGSRGADGRVSTNGKSGTLEIVARGSQRSIDINRTLPDDVAEELDIDADTKYYALIIAAQNYNHLIPLHHPFSDATRLKQVLEEKYIFNGGIEYFEDPTEADLNRLIRDYTEKLTAKDNLLIFYAGHGYVDTTRNTGNWIPVDGEEIPNDYTWYKLRDLKIELSRSRGLHILVVTDACDGAGLFLNERSAFYTPLYVSDPDYIKPYYSIQSRIGMTSGSFETVPDKSVFAESFIKYLKRNNDKYTTSLDIYASVRKEVARKISKRPRHEYISGTGDTGGDFVFILK